MKKIVHIENHDLLCDACGHVEKNVPAETTEQRHACIGLPCPVCGASLLTQEDFEAAERMHAFADLANKWLGPIFGKEQSEMKPEDGETYSINPRANSVHIQKKV